MQVRMTRESLVEKLTQNRKDHIEFYTEAKNKYVAELKELMEEALIQLNETNELDLKAVQSLVIPQTYVEQYDEAISMLEHTVENEIVLSEIEFRNYVMDKWSWSRQFGASNIRYLSGESTTKLNSKM